MATWPVVVLALSFGTANACHVRQSIDVADLVHIISQVFALVVLFSGLGGNGNIHGYVIGSREVNVKIIMGPA